MSLQSALLVNASKKLSDNHLAAIDIFKGYPDGLLKFATVSCVIITLIGIPGNIITIVALARYEKVRNATAIFIMNLSFSDLIFCFNIPFAASVFHNRAWIHGQIICQISLVTRYTMIVNSLLTVLTITINRYILIAHPKIYTKIYKKRNVITLVVCLWMFSFLSITPIIFEKYETCSILKDYEQSSIKKAIFSTVFILTCTAIMLCYSRIFCIVRKVNKKSLNNGKRMPLTKVSSSDGLSISVSVRVTHETSCNYKLQEFNTTKMLLRNLNTTDQYPEMKTSDKIIRQPGRTEKIPRLHQTTLKKSFKFLKMGLPTRRDRRLGTMIVAIMITFCLCHLPIMTTKIFLEKNLDPKLNLATHILFFMTFSINPIIYVVMSNEYRKAYKNLFKCR